MTTDPKNDEKLVYANWVRLDATPYDVSMQFGYRMGETPPKDPAVQLVMTWEHAKDVLTLLGGAVEQYDKNVGTIRDFGSVVTPAKEPAKKPPAQRRKRR
jgi:Protein of unknown function (DUF3467)